MEKQNSSGFREIEHTADWALEVWAPDRDGLFVQAALGMYRLMGVSLEKQSGEIQRFDLSAMDDESLLVSFLSELLYRNEIQHIACDSIHVDCEDFSLHAQFEARPIAAQTRSIKAVTYHNLAILHETDRWSVRIVFDV